MLDIFRDILVFGGIALTVAGVWLKWDDPAAALIPAGIMLYLLGMTGKLW